MHGLREATWDYVPGGGYGRSIGNLDILKATQRLLLSHKEVGFGSLKGDVPCTMGLLLTKASNTELPGGSYCSELFTIIPIVNDKLGPQESNEQRRNRMLAWVDKQIEIELRAGYRTCLTEEEIAHHTTVPIQ